jgi:hypothetical protein
MLEQRDGLAAQYYAGASCCELATKYKVSAQAVYGLLVRRGVRIRTNSESHKRCSLNESAFAKITPEAAYWAGFIFADGCIFRRSGSAALTIRITESDVEHLEKFRKFLGSSHAITRVKKDTRQFAGAKASVQFSVRSDTIVSALEAWGWRPKLQHKPIAELCESRDFWRGVLDGDGHISLRHSRPRLELVGGFDLLNAFQGFLSKNMKTGSTVRKHKSIYRIQLSSKRAIEAADLLYGRCSVALSRKLNAALNIKRFALHPQNFVGRGTPELTLGEISQ